MVAQSGNLENQALYPFIEMRRILVVHGVFGLQMFNDVGKKLGRFQVIVVVKISGEKHIEIQVKRCLLYTSPSPRD